MIEYRMQNEIQPAIQTEIQTEIQPKSKTTHCLNCGKEFEGNFCPKCGQSADTGRFTLKFIWENLLAAFLSKDGGIWFTIKNLFSRPGAMIVDILNGKRRKYFSPFPMLFCTLTLYALILSFTGSHHSFREFENKLLKSDDSEIALSVETDSILSESTDIEADIIRQKSEKVINDMKKLLGNAVSIYNHHYTLVYMLTLPLFVIAARGCYGKKNRKRYNWTEYTVAIVYAMVIVVLYRCIVSLVYLASPNISERMGWYMPIVIALAFTVCFKKMMGVGIKKTVWRSILTTAFYFLLLFILLMIAVAIVIAYISVKVR